MKKATLILIILIGFLYLGWIKGIPGMDCAFLQHLQFRNGVDTVTARVVGLEVGIVTDQAILQKLERSGKLRARDFGYAFSFRPVDCPKTYYISSSDTSSRAMAVFKAASVGKLFEIRCIVFKDFRLQDDPFFVIDCIKQL
jgi:hypothetical protein